MDEPVFDQGTSKNFLTQIREGMTVYDREGKKVGTVEDIYFGEVDPQTDEFGLGPQDVSGPGAAGESRGAVDFAFGGIISPSGEIGEMDETVRKRLLREGYVRMDTSGLFSSDRYILPDTIKSISEDAVHLRVSGDELIKP
jgi:uncharacterized protein YrrD